MSSISELIGIAGRHHSANRFAEAELCYRQLLNVAPGLADLHNNLGSALQGQGKLDLAIQCYRQAVDLDAGHAVAHCNLGVLLQQRGQLELAAHHYEQASQLKPDYADAHCNLGTVLLARGLTVEAAEKFKLAVALQPESAVAHNNLGCVLLDLGQLAASISAYHRAIALKPDYAEAFRNLGVALKEFGQIEAAISCFRRAIALNPLDADSYNHYAQLLKDNGELPLAETCCEKALQLAPDFPAGHCTRGSILQDRGRFTDAELAFKRALELKPGYPEALYNMTLLKRCSRGDPIFAVEDESLKLLPEVKHPYLYFARAKALEDVGDYADSFQQLAIGNKIKRQFISYDESAVQERFQTIARHFDQSLMNRYRSIGNPTSTPVFILGMPRSGSTLIEQILSSHRQIYGAGELRLLSIVANSYGAYPACCSNLDVAHIQRLAGEYLKGLPASAGKCLRITDKMPGNFEYVGLIHLMFPNARIIHTVRNPADTCFSCFSKLFASGMPYSYELRELGRYHQMYQRLMDHWRSVLPEGVMIDACYEQLVDDLPGQARRLIAHLGLEWDEHCLAFDKNDRPVFTASNVRVREPVYRGSINRWRRYESQLQPLLNALGEKMS